MTCYEAVFDLLRSNPEGLLIGEIASRTTGWSPGTVRTIVYRMLRLHLIVYREPLRRSSRLILAPIAYRPR